MTLTHSPGCVSEPCVPLHGCHMAADVCPSATKCFCAVHQDSTPAGRKQEALLLLQLPSPSDRWGTGTQRGCKTQPQSHSSVWAEPGLQLRLWVCVLLPWACAMGRFQPWVVGTGQDKAGLLHRCIDRSVNMESGQGLELELSIISRSRLAPVWAQVEPTGMGPLLWD